MFKKIKLKNGLKMILVPIKGSKTATIITLVGVGSKYESKENNGISHFIEHALFKGTKKRPSAQELAIVLDTIGAQYNAFTGKEKTGFWVKAEKDKLNVAIDYLFDILNNSKFDAKAIEKEKKVIIEEINMYYDTPMMYVEDLFESLLYKGTPAGWDIIGTKENVAKFKRQDLVSYFKQYYFGNNMVVCLAGNFSSDNIILAKKYFEKIKTGKKVYKLKTRQQQSKPKVLTHFKKTDQTHFCLGVRAFDVFSKKSPILDVMAIILGGNMSSRLFTELRVKNGLAYYIKTSNEEYSDTGYLMSQAGVPNNKVVKAVEIVLQEYKKLKINKVSRAELERAKDFIKGKMAINLEDSNNVANYYAEQEIIKKSILTPNEYLEKINQVTSGQIQKVAQEIFVNKGLNLALIGNFQDGKQFEDVLKI